MAYRSATAAIPALLLASCAGTGLPHAYPESTRGPVVDDYHGTSVADPYRWLETSDGPRVRAWIKAQNDLTQSLIADHPLRERVRSTIDTISGGERYGAPSRHGDHYYFSYTDGVMGQPLLLEAPNPGATVAESRIILDPNTWSSDGTISLGGTSFSPTGRYLAYGTSDGGSDWRTWRVRDLTTGRDLADVIRWSRFSRPEWSPDETRFTYLRFPETKDRLAQKGLRPSLWSHTLGTSQEKDRLVFEDVDDPQRFFWLATTQDGEIEHLSQGKGTARRNFLWFREASKGLDGEWIRTFDSFDASYTPLGNEGWVFWIWTDHDAPKGRVIKVDCSAPGLEWTEVIPEQEHTLESASMVGGRLLCHYLVDAYSEVRVHDPEGELIHKLDLPGIGSVSGLEGRQDQAETFLTYTSFATPGITYRYSTEDRSLVEVRRRRVPLNLDRFMAKQVFFESLDGTRIPLFIVHPRDIELDGQNPVLLHGYGGFNIAMKPRFSPAAAAWLELGGIYAVCCLRGGGEYGMEWHQAGTLERKQNVFDDFIGAAQHLIQAGYTSPEKLAIQGGSNGGLLVGACITQRPDLFGAALPAVGVLDMLRYQEWTIGIAWAGDYGLSSDPEMFPYLHAYSPVHNTRPGTKYPAVLITTGDHDDRVVPYHSFKFAAALQHAQAAEAPVLIRIETRAGHGAGKSRGQRLEETADAFTFLLDNLGVEPN